LRSPLPHGVRLFEPPSVGALSRKAGRSRIARLPLSSNKDEWEGKWLSSR
jgi:hypothetical protein